MDTKKKLLFIEKFRTPFRDDDDSDTYLFIELGFEITFKSVTSLVDILDIESKLSDPIHKFDVIVLMVESLSASENIALNKDLVLNFKELLVVANKKREKPILLVGVHHGLAPQYFREQSELFESLFISNILTYEQHKRVMKDILFRSNSIIQPITKNDLPVLLERRPVGKSFENNQRKGLYIEHPPQPDFWDCSLFRSIGFEMTCVFIDELDESLNIDNKFSLSFTDFNIIVLAIAGLDRYEDKTFPENLVNKFKTKLNRMSQNKDYRTILMGQHNSLNPIYFQSQANLFNGHFFTYAISDYQREIIRKITE